MDLAKALQTAAGNAGGGDFYSYTIDNSVYTGDGTKYIYHTGALASTPTDRKKLSISFWFKKSNFYSETSQTDFYYYGSNYGYPSVGIFDHSSGDQIEITNYRPSPEPRYLMHTDTDMAFRDVSAWYHMFLVVDTTLSTATDRYRIYVNGSEITHTWRNQSSNTPQNVEFHFFNLAKYAIGAYINPNTEAYDPRGNGYYLAEYHAVDGTAYAPTDFGQFKNGVWIPKEATGISYGNGGFYLNFADSSDLGKDVSGNANHFSTSGMSSTDQVIDTPTNNFMHAGVLVPRIVSGTTYKPLNEEGNLLLSTKNSSSGFGQGFPQSGKWYFEFQCRNSYPGGGYRCYIGVATNTPSSTDASTGADADDNFLYRYYDFGDQNRYYIKSLGGWQQTDSAGSNSLTNGTIVGMAVDMDNGSVTAYINGTLAKSITWASSAFSRKDVRLVLGGDGSPSFSNTLIDFNFGQNGSFNGQKTAQGNSDENGYGDFYYTPPSGYLAVCSQNMPEPTIGPNSDTLTGENFNTVLWTGTGSTNNITGVGFQPDWVWIKNRSAAQNNVLHDAVRGAGKYIMSDSTNDEATNTNQLSSFDSDGFTVGTAISTNQSGSSFVGWNWKGNGSGSSNTDGSITSTVSANTDAGFSIVTYTGNATNSTVGHGLNSAPEVVIVKARARTGGASDWPIMFQAANSGNGQNGWIRLNITNAWATTAILWNNTSPTSSVFSIGTYDYVNDNGTSHVAYCFHSVEGFSKFGSYTGNGSTDGPFVYTGFRPAFVLIKSSSLAQSWVLKDTARFTSNVTKGYLLADTSAAEVTDHSPTYTDILSNGFKLRGSANATNASGASYIYMAFAENPFKYSTAR